MHRNINSHITIHKSLQYSKLRPKIILIAVLILSAFPKKMQAQFLGSISIKASATVVEQTEIELRTIKNLDLDESSAINGIITVSALTDPAAGVMVVKGKPNANFRITYLPQMALTNAYGTGTLVVNYEVYGYQDDNQKSSTPLDAVDLMQRFNQDGLYYLWVGGRINISDAREGNYDGEFTLKVEYI